jgi:hypothetical protein
MVPAANVPTGGQVRVPRPSAAVPPRCGVTLDGGQRCTSLVPRARPAPDRSQSGDRQPMEISRINRRHDWCHLGRHRGKAGKLLAYEIMAHTLAQAVSHVLRDATVDREALLFGPYQCEGGRQPERLTGTSPAPLRGSGLLRRFPRWICQARELDLHWRGPVPSRRGVREAGTEPMSFWCLSRTCGTT